VSPPIRIRPADTPPPLAEKALRILERELRERARLQTRRAAGAPDIALTLDPDLPAESYRIDRSADALSVTAADPAGLLYGVGRLLRESVTPDSGFTPCDPVPLSVPDCKTRGIYFAHNFHNWYRSAPLAEIVRYVEELALWGLNALVFPVDTNPQCPLDEILGVMIPKQLKVIEAARACGIRTGVIAVANTVSDLPSGDLAATPVPDTDPPRRGQKGHRVCPSNPRALALLADRFDRLLELYRPVGLDFAVAFPYDEGGCGCDKCRPWGANGYVKAAKVLSRAAKDKYPGCRFIAGTWCFDVLDEPEGEYAGLDRAIRAEPGWCDAVMCDSHGDFPAWPLENGPPGALPMISFPEISMWGRWPWGGYGANPFPRRVSAVWNQAARLLDGGFPYSEGRYEDINKVTCLGLFWNRKADWRDILRAYIRYEFGAVASGDVLPAVALLEQSYPAGRLTPARAKEALCLLDRAARRLPRNVLDSWRWRYLYLRALIDVETATHPGRTGVASETQARCFRELTRLSCAENAEWSVRPPAP
jgi:hypothetical protein